MGVGLWIFSETLDVRVRLVDLHREGRRNIPAGGGGPGVRLAGLFEEAWLALHREGLPNMGGRLCWELLGPDVGGSCRAPRSSFEYDEMYRLQLFLGVFVWLFTGRMGSGGESCGSIWL